MTDRVRNPFRAPAYGVVARLGRPAFTLVEVLVVMGIIVLLVALALPAFSFITGSRSTEAAGNQIAAALGVARAQAIGLQKYCGVMFFIEPTSDRVQITLVQETASPVGADGAPATLTAANPVYLDIVSDAEFVKLPAGVGVQTVTNGLINGSVFTPNDRYIGFNINGMNGQGTARPANSPLPTQVGGVILFDGSGQLASKRYVLRSRANPLGSSPAFVANRMGALLFSTGDATGSDNASQSTTPADYIPALKVIDMPMSQLGIVLYDADVFASRGFTPADQRTGTAAASESAEEAWLDENAAPSMINRYNGTLVRGE